MTADLWLRRPPAPHDGDGLVICFPFAGGSAASFRPLSRDLPAGWRQVGVELPGRGARFGEPPVPDIDAAAAAVTTALLDLGDVPLVLFGHSMGALLAYEVTCRLEKAERGPRALVASGSRSPADVLGRPRITDLPEAEFRTALLELGLARTELFEDPDIAEMFVPVLRGDLRLCEGYAWGRSTKVRAPLTVTGGLDDRLVPPAALHRWTRLAAGPVEVEQLRGGHMYATDRGSGLGRLVARVCTGTASPAAPPTEEPRRTGKPTEGRLAVPGTSARRARPPAPADPVVIVFYDRGAALPMTVRLAARGICRPVFFCDLSDPRVAADMSMVPRTTEVLDIAGMSTEEICDAAVKLESAGIVTFSDNRLRTAAEVAAPLGLPFHTPRTADLLVDKVRQRHALATAGVQSTPSVPLHTAKDLEPALAETGLPAVLKPRSGAGSVDACLVRSAPELAERFAEFGSDRRAASGYVLERYLAGAPDTLGPFWGDYVSVESLVHQGEVHTVTMTGKLPMVPPFRETGMFIPAAVPAPLAEQVIALERAALRALGVLHGATHTEIKFTPDGPRIIEVNGRMGGHIADPLSRAAGIDLIALTLRLALGQCDPVAPLLTVGPRCPKVAYQFLLTPPEQTSVPGDRALLDDLADLPGVSLVDLALEPGWRPDWRAGTEWVLGTVYGTAADHHELRETVERLHERTEPFWRRRQEG